MKCLTRACPGADVLLKGTTALDFSQKKIFYSEIMLRIII